MKSFMMSFFLTGMILLSLVVGLAPAIKLIRTQIAAPARTAAPAPARTAAPAPARTIDPATPIIPPTTPQAYKEYAGECANAWPPAARPEFVRGVDLLPPPAPGAQQQIDWHLAVPDREARHRSGLLAVWYRTSSRNLLFLVVHWDYEKGFVRQQYCWPKLARAARAGKLPAPTLLPTPKEPTTTPHNTPPTPSFFFSCIVKIVSKKWHKKLSF